MRCHRTPYLAGQWSPDNRAIHEMMDEIAGKAGCKDWSSLPDHFVSPGIVWNVKIPGWPSISDEAASIARPADTLANYLARQLEHYGFISTRLYQQIIVSDDEASWSGALDLTLYVNAHNPFSAHHRHWKMQACLVRRESWKVKGLHIEDLTNEYKARHPNDNDDY